MKEMSGYQMDEVSASLRMSLSFDPTTLIEIAVYNSQLTNHIKTLALLSNESVFRM